MHARRILWTMLALATYASLFANATPAPVAPASADSEPDSSPAAMECIYVDPWAPDVGVDPEECTTSPARP